MPPRKKARRARPATAPTASIQRVPLAVMRATLLPFVGVDYLFGCARGPFARGRVEVPAARLGRLCTLLHAAARQLDPDSGTAERTPHLTVPSSEFPSVPAAIEAVEKFRRAGGTRRLEIRLHPGEHDICSTPGSPLWLGPAFSGVTMCGIGPGRTLLTGGMILAEPPAKESLLTNSSVRPDAAPFCLEAVTLTNPRGSGLSLGYRARLTSCTITDCRRNGVHLVGPNAALELLDTVLARNGGHGLSAHTGAHAQIRGASSRIHGNLSCGLFVQNMFGDYRREERTTVTVSGLGSKPPARTDDGYFKHYPSGRSTSTLFERTGDHPNTGHDIVEYGTGSVVFLE